MHIYLVQRGKINRPLGKFEGQRLSKAVNLDYMGAAEFEFGALPKSFMAIEARVDAATLRIVPEIRQHESPLRVFSTMSDDEWSEYLSELLKLRAGALRTKENARFTESEVDNTPSYGHADFWWDIGNHVMFSFDKVFMKRIHEHVAASLNYMNEK